MKKRIEEPRQTFSFLEKRPNATIGKTSISKGDVVKVTGEMGNFKFDAHVTNTRTGDQWIDVYEMQGDRTGNARAFATNRIKVAKRGRRA